jgi:hypothetical protein
VFIVELDSEHRTGENSLDVPFNFDILLFHSA